MKIRTLFLSLLLVAGINDICAQNRVADVRRDGFVGRVRQVSSNMYEAVSDDDNVQRGDLLERTQTTYSAKGERRGMVYFSVAEENVMFRSRYKRDAFGQTTLEQIVDDDENVIGRTYYIYDPNFYLVESYVEDAERQVECRTLYKYDGSGRVSHRSLNDPENNVYRREVYTYNADGTVLKVVVYDREKKKMQELRYEYDDHRQPVTLMRYDYTEEEPEVFITIYRYRYDDNGNWVQKTEYSEDGGMANAEYITERTIEYF